MQFLIIPLDELKEFDPYWETRRRSNDGTKAIIHKEIVDALIPPVMTLELQVDENGNEIPQERTYPYPIASGEEINEMEDFKSKEEPSMQE